MALGFGAFHRQFGRGVIEPPLVLATLFRSRAEGDFAVEIESRPLMHVLKLDLVYL